ARGAVLIRDRDGASVAVAGGDMEGLFALPPVVEPGDEAGVPVAYGYYVAVDERHLLVVADARVPGWSLALMRPRADARAFADAQARRNHALALLAAALAVTVAFVTGHRIATPLARLTANLARFTSGDIDTRTPVESEDELGELAGRFNAMAAQVGNLLHSLEQQARRLRAEIAERTEQEVKLQAQSEALSEARDQALAANRAKSAFLARMSHELRTPLNAVIGYGELIQEIAEEEANEEVARDADAIVRSARHLLELINDVLDLSKIEAGRMEVHIEDFDAAEMIRDVTSVAQPLVERQRNQLVTLLDRDAIPMRSDRTKLRQCLLNLLSNAAKFTEDGTIEVRVRHESLGALPVIVIAVSDTGVGLDEEEQKRLFGAFSQVDNELTRRHGGTGLGLAITRRLCRKLGGDISVESARGVGTTFTMRLPLRFTRSLDSTAVGYSSERGRFY
ncbi:MAG TPA: ATP-binding protein, partial [Nannocystaceae bacterium]|nr:ATP-binding protein [Nannocystaceae bacterium]